ncbi:GGDEF domain-containing protein [Bacillus solitudinis]|uniref:GGDEF domain-containing protein n=1 Tax=Bacillus solitudinis TaxID=2014074 RepID=UPI0012FE3A4D|nr:GGDEF domain-containing protein [Bacillus solitudinis]
MLTLQINSEFVEFDDEHLKFLMIRDITEVKVVEAKMQYLAYHDPLTGLLNRLVLHSKFQELITIENPFSIVMIDLDKFKEINDTYGHQIGDQVLQYIASLLKQAGEETDSIYRIGGDEFLILIIEPEGSVEKVRNYIEESLKHSVTSIVDTPLSLSLSIGVSRYPEDGTNEDILIKRADEDMYLTKRTKKGSLLER